MADINLVGVDLSNGQLRPITVSDTPSNSDGSSLPTTGATGIQGNTGISSTGIQGNTGIGGATGLSTGSNVGSLFVPIDNMYEYSTSVFPTITVDGSDVQGRYRAFVINDVGDQTGFAFTFVVPEDYSDSASWVHGTGTIRIRLAVTSSSGASGDGLRMAVAYSVYQASLNTKTSSGGTLTTSTAAATAGPALQTLVQVDPLLITGGISPGDVITCGIAFDPSLSGYEGTLYGRALFIEYPKG